jgi:hypothetical protein
MIEVRYAPQKATPVNSTDWLVMSNQFAPSIIAALLVIIVALFIVALIVLVKRRKPTTVVLDTTGFTVELDRIMKSTAHAAEVSAVLGLMKDLEDYPDALALIAEYPKTVQAAAWMHGINQLGSDLQAAQTMLSHAHQQTGPYLHEYRIGEVRKACQQHVDILQGKLDAAVKASGGSHLRPVN